MGAFQRLPIVILVIAGIVAVSLSLPSLIVMVRPFIVIRLHSPIVLIVGAIWIFGSYIELLLTPILAWRLAMAPRHASIEDAGYLLTGAIASVPAVLMSPLIIDDLRRGLPLW